MKRALFVTASSTMLALAGLLTACGKSPTSPNLDETPQLEIVGPRTVAPGETVQFRLLDQRGRDLTNEASWSSYGASWCIGGSALSIGGPGLAIGLGCGDARIEAIYRERNAFKEVIVVPAGTYRLTGNVIEAEVHPGPVAGARIEVTTGAGAGLVRTTFGDGHYRLYGVGGTTTIHVTKDGYQPQTRTIHVVDHQTFDIELPLLEPRPDVSGTYMLTITAADECRVGLGEGYLPEEARIRRYTAVVTQRGPELEAVLTGATFVAPYLGAPVGDRFPGRVVPRGAVFELKWDDFDGPKLVEQLPTSTLLIVHGTVVATGTADRLIGMLAGYFQVVNRDLSDRESKTLAWCQSATHQFVFSR